VTSDVHRDRSDFDADEQSFLSDLGEDARLTSASSCPPVRLILAAGARVLPADLQERIASHVSRCAACRALARDLAELETAPLSPEEDERIASRLRVSWTDRSSQPQPAARARWAAHLPMAAMLALAAGLGAWTISLQRENGVLTREMSALRQSIEGAARRASTSDAELTALRDARARADAQTNVTVVDLEPRAALRSSTAVRSFVLNAGEGRTALILTASRADNVAEWRLEVTDERGKTAWEVNGLRPGPLGTFNVLAPTAQLPDGLATLTLYSVRDGRRELRDSYLARFAR